MDDDDDDDDDEHEQHSSSLSIVDEIAALDAKIIAIESQQLQLKAPASALVAEMKQLTDQLRDPSLSMDARSPIRSRLNAVNTQYTSTVSSSRAEQTQLQKDAREARAKKLALSKQLERAARDKQKQEKADARDAAAKLREERKLATRGRISEIKERVSHVREKARQKVADVQGHLVHDHEERKAKRVAAATAAHLAGAEAAGATTTSPSSSNSATTTTSSAPSVASSASSEIFELMSTTFARNFIFESTDVEIVSYVSEGAGGKVYKVRVMSTNRLLAAKSFQYNTADELARALRECECSLKLQHPNIVQFVGVVGQHQQQQQQRGEIMLLMELADSTLDSILKKATNETDPNAFALPFDVVVDFAKQIAAGLAYLHSQSPKIIHLDIKPANILVCGGGGRALKLCDLGIARHAQHTITDISVAAGGTLKYMCPSLFVGDPTKIATMCDSYSFGVLLFWMITGREPWKNSTNVFEIAQGRLVDRLEPVRDGCPRFLVDLCARCLQIDRGERPKDGVALVELLRDGEKAASMASPTASLLAAAAAAAAGAAAGAADGAAGDDDDHAEHTQTFDALELTY